MRTPVRVVERGQLGSALARIQATSLNRLTELQSVFDRPGGSFAAISGPAAGLVAASRELLASAPGVLTHYDFWSGNAVWENGVFTGVVDWSGGAIRNGSPAVGGLTALPWPEIRGRGEGGARQVIRHDLGQRCALAVRQGTTTARGRDERARLQRRTAGVRQHQCGQFGGHPTGPSEWQPYLAARVGLQRQLQVPSLVSAAPAPPQRYAAADKAQVSGVVIIRIQRLLRQVGLLRDRRQIIQARQQGSRLEVIFPLSFPDFGGHVQPLPAQAEGTRAGRRRTWNVRSLVPRAGQNRPARRSAGGRPSGSYMTR